MQELASGRTGFSHGRAGTDRPSNAMLSLRGPEISGTSGIWISGSYHLETGGKGRKGEGNRTGPLEGQRRGSRKKKRGAKTVFSRGGTSG